MSVEGKIIDVIFNGVYLLKVGKRKVLATKNLTPGITIYNEKLIVCDGAEYRSWNPFRSKLAGAILKGLKFFPVKEGDQILYLGAATGTTASHISDIVGKEGGIYCIEISERCIRELVHVCVARRNMYPILADARRPEMYMHLVPEVDGIYCDVAQPEQAGLVNLNAKYFLRDGGYLYLAIKARSIDVTKAPYEIYKKEIETLKKGGFELIDVVHLDPFDKDHAMVLARYNRSNIGK